MKNKIIANDKKTLCIANLAVQQRSQDYRVFRFTELHTLFPPAVEFPFTCDRWCRLQNVKLPPSGKRPMHQSY